MRFRFSSVLLVAFMLPVASVSAQMSGKTQGRYATHTISDDVQQMEDGSAVVLSHYHQSTFADDKGHPIDNTSSTCVGLIKLDANGGTSSANGSCFTYDGDGDEASFWWRMTDNGSANCMDICGEWGYFAGDGKFAGIQGTGTWKRTTLFDNGSSGTWTGSYTLKK